MTAREVAEAFVRVLDRVKAGTVEATVDGASFAVLDGARRNLTVQIGPLLGERGGRRSLLRESHLSLWKARGIPSALARSGWKVSLQDGTDELVRLGRGATALTGHVRMGPAALGRLRRLL